MRIYYHGEWWYYQETVGEYDIYQNVSGETVKFKHEEVPNDSR